MQNTLNWESHLLNRAHEAIESLTVPATTHADSDLLEHAYQVSTEITRQQSRTRPYLSGKGVRSRPTAPAEIRLNRLGRTAAPVSTSHLARPSKSRKSKYNGVRAPMRAQS